MSQGHRHLGGPEATQNQGNVLGDRPCVRQSRLYREHVGGNAMKELLGQDTLKWDTQRQQGVYSGKPVFDHNQPPAGHVAAAEATQQGSFRRGSGNANKQTYNCLTGQ
jgi:hypothetical protein